MYLNLLLLKLLFLKPHHQLTVCGTPGVPGPHAARHVGMAPRPAHALQLMNSMEESHAKDPPTAQLDAMIGVVQASLTLYDTTT
jgi:hypothetical protein